MNDDEKKEYIAELFKKNISECESVKIALEDGKLRFCLLLKGTRIVSVLIEKSFIEKTDKEEIKSHFEKENIYRLITDNRVITTRADIVIWPDDKACCRKQNKNP